MQCAILCLNYLKDYPSRRETIECIDLLMQLCQSDLTVAQYVFDELHSLLLQQPKALVIVDSNKNIETMSSSSESSFDRMNSSSSLNDISLSLSSQFIQIEKILKPYDMIFEICQRYLSFDLYLSLGSKLDVFRQVYHILKHFIQDDITKQYDEGYLCRAISMFLDSCH